MSHRARICFVQCCTFNQIVTVSCITRSWSRRSSRGKQAEEQAAQAEAQEQEQEHGFRHVGFCTLRLLKPGIWYILPLDAPVLATVLDPLWETLY